MLTEVLNFETIFLETVCCVSSLGEKYFDHLSHFPKDQVFASLQFAHADCPLPAILFLTYDIHHIALTKLIHGPFCDTF